MDYGEGSSSNSGWPDSLSWFGDNRDFPGIADALSKRGFSDGELSQIMGGNWVSLLNRAATPASPPLQHP
jgi:microsomal dipeptidase-like Zn-dependent dipeptidase